MAENKLTAPAALYDYVLYHECAQKDWSNPSAKKSVKGDGSLMDAINWNSTSTTVPGDSGGATLFGVTHGTWKSYVNSHKSKGYNPNLNTMGKKGWIDIIGEYFWDEYSSACRCANYACAMMLFQMAWGGFSASKECLSALRSNKDKDYKFSNKGNNYRKIADATHAYNDPMKAYGIMRQSIFNYIYNISTPDKTNKKFRVGWMRRYVLAFTPTGLFIDDGVSYTQKHSGLSYSSSISQWEGLANKWESSNKSGYIRLLSWGATPDQIANMTSSSYDPNYVGSGSSTSFSGSSYTGCGGVYQLGNYTQSPDMTVVPQQTQSREEVLKTLMSGSYTPGEVKKCVELITSDKKKNSKTKSEN